MKRSRPRLAFLVVALTACSVPRALADVHVVAPSGGDFAQISDAVAAASDGDVILVKTGTYGGFTIAHKSLAVVADAGASVDVTAQIRVTGLSATLCVTLSGLHVFPTTTSMQDALKLESCSGSVRVQSSTFHGADMTGPEPYPIFSHGATIIGCSDVAMTHCTFEGGRNPIFEGIFGIYADLANVVLDGCEMRGSRGGYNAGNLYGYPGGEGVLARTLSVIRASGSTFRGGPGALIPPGALGGSGGSGLDSTFGSRFSLVECALIPGVGTGSEPPAPPYLLHGGTVSFVAGIARDVVPPAPAREGEAIALQLHGAPGERVEIVVSTAAHFVERDDLAGVLLVPRRGARIAMLGTTDATGDLAASIPVGDLGPGVEGRVLRAQVLYSGAQGELRAGPTFAITLLDAAL